LPAEAEWPQYLKAVGGVAIVTLLNAALQPFVGHRSVGMSYLMMVVVLAIFLNCGPGDMSPASNQNPVVLVIDDEVQIRRLLRLTLAARRVSLKGQEVRLTTTEYNVLRLLVRHAGKVLTHRQILKEVWGQNAGDQMHYLRVYPPARVRFGAARQPRTNVFVRKPGEEPTWPG
jgi:hypothetical protein